MPTADFAKPANEPLCQFCFVDMSGFDWQRQVREFIQFSLKILILTTVANTPCSSNLPMPIHIV
jgi:hypothetical protein